MKTKPIVQRFFEGPSALVFLNLEYKGNGRPSLSWSDVAYGICTTVYTAIRLLEPTLRRERRDDASRRTAIRIEDVAVLWQRGRDEPNTDSFAIALVPEGRSRSSRRRSSPRPCGWSGRLTSMPAVAAPPAGVAVDVEQRSFRMGAVKRQPDRRREVLDLHVRPTCYAWEDQPSTARGVRIAGTPAIKQ